MDDNTDIVEYLRRNAAFNYKDTYIAAADEIERLRKERDEAIALIENIAKEVNVLSTRPTAIIKFSDLVDQINEWGDTARNILDKKANSNV